MRNFFFINLRESETQTRQLSNYYYNVQNVLQISTLVIFQQWTAPTG